MNPGTPIRRAAMGRCPQCGEGKLFDGYLKVAPACAHCGLGFGAQDAADGPAVFIVLFFGFVVAGLVFLVEATYAPPFWLHALIWPPFILAGSLALLRPLKGMFIGIQYRYRSVDRVPPADGGGA